MKDFEAHAVLTATTALATALATVSSIVGLDALVGVTPVIIGMLGGVSLLACIH